MKSSIPAGNRRFGGELPPLVLAALALVLTGCSSDGNAEWQGIYQTAKSAFQKAPVVTLDQAAAIPFATLGVTVDDGQEMIAVLATANGGQQLWASGKTVTLVTIDGRIQRTVGLAHNLSWSTITPAAPGHGPLEDWQTPRRVTWTDDYNETGQYSVQIVCDERPTRNEQIMILGQSISTLRIDATCRSAQLNWTFKDVYWVGRPDGVVWRSVQYIHPKLGPVVLETLRPPG